MGSQSLTKQLSTVHSLLDGITTYFVWEKKKILRNKYYCIWDFLIVNFMSDLSFTAKRIHYASLVSLWIKIKQVSGIKKKKKNLTMVQENRHTFMLHKLNFGNSQKLKRA